MLPPAVEIDPPENVEEAKRHLELVFGEFDPDQSKLSWVYSLRDAPYTSPQSNDSAEGDPAGEKESEELNTIMEDWASYGTPFKLGEAVAVDRVSMRRAWVFREKDPKREPVWTQMRHSASRYLFRRLSSGTWTVESSTLVHSNPSFVGSAYGTGTVTWYQDGVKMTMTAVDAMIAEDGKWHDAALSITAEWRALEGRLVGRGEYQYFEFAELPEGENPSNLPDFSKPLGPKYPFRYRAELREVGVMPELDAEPASVENFLNKP